MEAQQGEQTLRAYVRANYKTIAVVVIFGLLLATIFYQKQNPTTTSHAAQASPAKTTAASEAANLQAKVGKIVDIPTDEEPTIATVEDPSKLKNQQFFARAQAGDKVLMFANAKLVVLYRPSSGKAIQIAPIDLGAGATASSVTGQ